MEANEALLVLGLAVRLDVPVSTGTEAAVVTTTQGCTLDSVGEHVSLIVAVPEELEVARVLGIANGLQNHIVSLLERDVADVFHGLHERGHLAESLLGLLLVVHGQRMLVIDVVATPKVLAKHPGQDELGQAAPLERTIVKQSGAPLLAEVPVSEHGRVSIEVGNAAGLALGGLSMTRVPNS